VRRKYTVNLPSIANDELSNILVQKCKNVVVTWISEQEAVISCEDSKSDMKEIFDKLGITLSSKTYPYRHNVTDDKEEKHEVINKW
jgi:hypothetical protein